MIFIIFNLLSSIAFATPTFLPASEQTATDQNFRDISTAINKADCTDGCTITGTITASSNAVFNASVTINGGVFGASFAQLNSTQTFSGGNTFVSSITIGPTSHTSTITFTSGALINSWQLVASTNPSAADLIFLTGFESSGTYKIIFNLLQNTSNATPYLRINSDSGANYRWANHRVMDDATHSVANSGADTECELHPSTNRATDPLFGEINLTRQAQITGGPDVVVYGNMFHVLNNATTGPVQFSCRYSGSGGFASVSFLPSAGTWTGYVYVYKAVNSTTR